MPSQPARARPRRAQPRMPATRRIARARLKTKVAVSNPGSRRATRPRATTTTAAIRPETVKEGRIAYLAKRIGWFGPHGRIVAECARNVPSVNSRFQLARGANRAHKRDVTFLES